MRDDSKIIPPNGWRMLREGEPFSFGTELMVRGRRDALEWEQFTYMSIDQKYSALEHAPLAVRITQNQEREW